MNLEIVKQALVEALDIGPNGTECNCDQGDGCIGECTRSTILRALADVEAEERQNLYAFQIKDGAGHVNMLSVRATSLLEAFGIMYHLLGGAMEEHGFRCWPAKE